MDSLAIPDRTHEHARAGWTVDVGETVRADEARLLRGAPTALSTDDSDDDRVGPCKRFRPVAYKGKNGQSLDWKHRWSDPKTAEETIHIDSQFVK